MGRLHTDPAVFSYEAQNTVAAYTATPNCTRGNTVKGFRRAHAFDTCRHASCKQLEIKATSCHLAGAISRQTRLANIWSQGVDSARRRNADVSHEGSATIAIASHPASLLVHVYRRNSIKTDFAFQRETRPFRRERAARATGSTRGRATSKRSFYLEVDRGFLSAIALDFEFDSLSLVE
jgi:hypothetical protein